MMAQDVHFGSNMQRQDESEWRVEREGKRVHGIRAPACTSHTASFARVRSALDFPLPWQAYEPRQVGVVLPSASPKLALDSLLHSTNVHARGCSSVLDSLSFQPSPWIGEENEGTMVVWIPYAQPLHWGNMHDGLARAPAGADSTLLFSTQTRDGSFTLVGATALSSSQCGALLRIGTASLCHVDEEEVKNEEEWEDKACAVEISVVSEHGILVDGTTVLLFLADYRHVSAHTATATKDHRAHAHSTC